MSILPITADCIPRQNSFDIMKSSSPPVSFPIRRVAIVGGTHGNETVGIALARYLQKIQPTLRERTGDIPELRILFGNDQAIRKNQRYLDEDMNRCFGRADLSQNYTGPNFPTYERERAWVLNQVLGPKKKTQIVWDVAEQRVRPVDVGGGLPDVAGATERTDKAEVPVPDNFDLIVDLHTTTGNTGINLMAAPTDGVAQSIFGFLLEQDAVDPEILCTEAPLSPARSPNDRRPGRSGVVPDVEHEPSRGDAVRADWPSVRAPGTWLEEETRVQGVAAPVVEGEHHCSRGSQTVVPVKPSLRFTLWPLPAAGDELVQLVWERLKADLLRAIIYVSSCRKNRCCRWCFYLLKTLVDDGHRRESLKFSGLALPPYRREGWFHTGAGARPVGRRRRHLVQRDPARINKALRFHPAAQRPPSEAKNSFLRG